MAKVTTQFTMSLEGFIAAPNDDVKTLFKWYQAGEVEFPVAGSDLVFKISQQSADLLGEEWANVGAIVTGRRDFDVSNAWGGEALFGVPTFIVTHFPDNEWHEKQPLFIFVTDGVERAITQAKKAAGEKNVSIGGTTIVQQCLRLGLLDEIQIDLVPLLLGKGIPLFDNLNIKPINLEKITVIDGTGVTHHRYRVLK
jgi:dihydrofolate reductase